MLEATENQTVKYDGYEIKNKRFGRSKTDLSPVSQFSKFLIGSNPSIAFVFCLN